MNNQRVMFHVWVNNTLIVEHADVNLQLCSKTTIRTQLRDVWHDLHPAMPFFQVAAFIRQPNGIFKMEKDHHA
jgi:hypothetical protein